MTFTRTLANWTVLAATVVGVGIAAAPAEAAALKWTLQDVTFNDGGTATGSFLFDADTNTFSDVNINTFLSNGNPLANYLSASGNANFSVSTTATLFPPTFKALFLGFSSPLTNLGGTVDLLPTIEIALADGFPLARSINAGTLSASATPIPTPALLPG
ncbi:hypothetical protein C7B61_06255, partial [filamentous cyanobacterium CCP1]